MAAILHDVGKVSIPDHILRKRDPLTDKDWEAIRQNPVRGAEMVSRIQGLEAIVPWVRHSHERFDGSGYPDGLSGDAIPQACRILHVADAFDAMISGRPYRRPMTPEEALDGAPARRRAPSSTPRASRRSRGYGRGRSTSCTNSEAARDRLLNTKSRAALAARLWSPVVPTDPALRAVRPGTGQNVPARSGPRSPGCRCRPWT